MLSNIYLLFTILIVITALFGYVNERFIKMPLSIGIMLMSMLLSVGILTIGKNFPDFQQRSMGTIAGLDFHALVIKIMLGFLLFASAYHINVRRLQREIIPVVTFASIGVLISTFIIGILSYWMLGFFFDDVNLIYCLLFGALISPTDPIAVMGIIKNVALPKSLKAKISGESLFNDGVGVLLFVILLEIANPGVENPSAGKMIWTFVQETGGGLLWGAILGYSSTYLHKQIDNYKIEVLITLAVVMGGYSFASYMHVSGPLSMVAAGIILGDKGVESMSDITSDYVGKFWELIDEILNALLFLLIGFEMLVIPFTWRSVSIGSLSVVIVLLGRWMSVLIPVFFLSFRQAFEKNSIAFLTWGGLRGGISIALALSLPQAMHRNRIVTITYFVVLFSILVQGLTIGKVAKKLSESQEKEEVNSGVVSA
jgi:CPA1 family monovalent cation:H+ antiporter